jgi:phytanoyl-CoA hydroxylase
MNEGDVYRGQGYVHVRGVFSPEEVEQMRAAIERILAGVAGTEHDENHVWKAVAQEAVLKGFHNVQYHDAVFARAVSQRRLVELLTEMIGPNVQLHHTKMLVKPPEKGAPFPMHQDYPYFGIAQAGAARGTGRSNTLDVPLEDGTPLPAEAGDVVFFNYLTIHGSGVNASMRTRRNVLFQYRDPEDPPVLRGRIEDHVVDWGPGLMVAGHNPVYWQRRTRFEVVPTA